MSIAETIYVRTIEDVVHWSQWVREAEMRGEISHEQAMDPHVTIENAYDLIKKIKKDSEVTP